MSHKFTSGQFLGDQLCNALGIEGAVCRLVIDCPADGIVMVYVQRPLDLESAFMPAVMRILEDAARSEEPPHVVEVDTIDLDLAPKPRSP